MLSFNRNLRILKYSKRANVAASGWKIRDSFNCCCVRNYSVGGQRWTRILPPVEHFRPEFASLSFWSGSRAIGQTPPDVGPIPEPPAIPSVESLEAVRRVAEENLHELGLGSYFTPVGWIQNLLGYLHSSAGLPWWEVIVLGTLVARALTLPIIISSQRRSADMLEHKPEMLRLVRQLEDAQKTGDGLKVQMAMLEYQQYLKEKHFPLMGRMLLPMFANGAVFASYFLALRSMASHALVGMRSEGLLWMTDLTVPDPTYILPTMCALTTFLVIELGIESGVGAKQIPPAVRWMMRMFPFAALLFITKLPAAVMCYWFTTNLISLVLSILFRFGYIRRLLKLPPLPPKETSSSLANSPRFSRENAPNASWRKGDSGPSHGSKSSENQKESR